MVGFKYEMNSIIHIWVKDHIYSALGLNPDNTKLTI